MITLLLTTAASIGLLTSFIMIFVTKAYLNNSPRRKRLIYLLWGEDNEWHRGKPFDLVTANAVVAGSGIAAWRMKHRLVTRKERALGFYVFPNLHQENNYIKLLDEFKFFTRWETVKAIITIFSFIAIGVLIAIE